MERLRRLVTERDLDKRKGDKETDKDRKKKGRKDGKKEASERGE